MNSPRLTNMRTSPPPARRLAFAVAGVAAALPLRAVLDSLHMKHLIAGGLGFTDSAQAFAAAARHVDIVAGPPDSPTALNTQLKDPRFDQLLEAALREVWRAYRLVPGSYTGPLVPAEARSPDPRLVHDTRSLAREMRILLGYTGIGAYTVALTARGPHGRTVTETALRQTLMNGDYPTSHVLDAVLNSCAVPDTERTAWHAAHARAAHARPVALVPESFRRAAR